MRADKPMRNALPQSGKLKPTPEQLAHAAGMWTDRLGRPAFQSDIDFFYENWRAKSELRACVEKAVSAAA